MEEIFDVLESFFRIIFNIVKWFINQLLIETLFHWVGRITLLILTLGTYPRGEQVVRDEDTINLTGAFICIILLILSFIFPFYT